jgi:hypothetical protein
MIVFIADFFVDEILGGGELNNHELIELLRAKGHNVKTIKSDRVTPSYLKKINASLFIVGNFIGLSEESKNELKSKNYVIYEHDHKYLRSRNPAHYNDFTAPGEELVNVEFYEKALRIFCQSDFHQSIIHRNLKTDNIISVGGNLWSVESLDLLECLSLAQKKDGCSILSSSIPHKNTREAVGYCEIKNLDYDLCASNDYESFLEQLSKNETLVFFPQTPETLSRIVVESRMMGMRVITNRLVGATQEKWFKLKGKDLIDVMRGRRHSIPQMVLECITQ